MNIQVVPYGLAVQSVILMLNGIVVHLVLPTLNTRPLKRKAQLCQVRTVSITVMTIGKRGLML